MSVTYPRAHARDPNKEGENIEREFIIINQASGV